MRRAGATDPMHDAARIFARSALCFKGDERFVLVEDSGSRPVGDAIARACEELGVWVRRIDLDDTDERRPVRRLPDRLTTSLQHATSSAFIAKAIHAEAPMRQALLHLVGERGLRHAHLPGIQPRSFVSGFQVDCAEVAENGAAALQVLGGAREIVCESDRGTRLSITLREGGRWFAQLGALTPGRYGNFPAGALYTSPADVNGVFVADASLGEFFGAREGLLLEKQVRLTIERGVVREVECPSDPALRDDVLAMLSFSANSARIGLVAVGVNHGITSPTGDASVDQNLPGLHLGIGDPAGKSTGAAWSAPTCFAACQARSRVMADAETLVDGGRLAGRLSRFELSPPPEASTAASRITD